MATEILTPANVIRYLEWKNQHDHLERLCKSWHQAFKEAVHTYGPWNHEGYSALLREYQRSHFQHKALLVTYPEIHEQFLTTLTIQALIIVGPSQKDQETSTPTPLIAETKPRRQKHAP